MNPFSLLGFAQAAGKIASGDTASIALIRRGKGRLLVLAEDAGQSTIRRFEHLAEVHGVPLVRFGTKGALGQSIGKGERAVLVILDARFARNFQEAAGAGRSSPSDEAWERGGVERS